MKNRNKFITPLIAQLLILLIGIAFVVPPEMRLELCFGKDGHVDFSLADCTNHGETNKADWVSSSVYRTASHNDCFHMAVACGTEQELIRNDGQSDSYKSELQKDPSQIPLFSLESFTDSVGVKSDLNVYPAPIEDFPQLHLVSLRTVVLLV